MPKVKLTKNEQKKQKDSLKRFKRYLPTLILKKQQLQMVIRQVEIEIERKENAIIAVEEGLKGWLAVFGENPVFLEGAFSPGCRGVEDLIQIESIEKGWGNIAGVEIPLFRGMKYRRISYDLFSAPLWIDRGLGLLKEIARLNAEIEVLKEHRRLLFDELRVTTQRVNLFEKVKIPETRENIRKIGIYLGDQQTAAVVRGKIAKNKVTRVT